MDLVARFREELGLDIEWIDGRPRLDVSQVRGLRWPRKVTPELAICMDPYVAGDTAGWPLPRFEILIANVDTIGLKVAACGVPEAGQADEKLLRAAADFSGKPPLKQAKAISETLLWIGHDTIWRHVAAAVGVPQVVIAVDGNTSEPRYADTHFVLPGKEAAESKALGPVSVTDVATVVSEIIKQAGHDLQ
jgi:ADP-heptose:LPS heptosyltransferase